MHRTQCVSDVAGILALIVAAVAGTSWARAQGAPAEQPDKYTWLEDIRGDKPMQWVNAQNARTAAVIEKQKVFAQLDQDALRVLDSPDKLAYPDFRGDLVYNTWRDKDHLRGIVRHTTLESYLSDDPKWETVIDYDALGKQDKQSWVGHGLNCMQPEEERCMVALSVGGEDAVTFREFNLKTATFVDGGFVMPRGKQRLAWLDKDTLLIGRDWGPGTMSEAGYPVTVRKWKRGTPLESAVEVYRGDTRDNGYGDDPGVLVDGQGHRLALIERSKTTFESEWYLLLPNGPRKLDLPLKCNVDGLVDNQVLVSLQEDWTPKGSAKSFAQGSVVAIDATAAQADPAHLKPVLVFAPSAQEFAQVVAPTKNHALLTTLEHVQGRAYVLTHEKDGQWTRTKLPVPDNQTIGITTTSLLHDKFFMAQTGFLTPSERLAGRRSGRFSEAGQDSKRLCSTLPAMWLSSWKQHRRMEPGCPTLWCTAKTFPWTAARPR